MTPLAANASRSFKGPNDHFVRMPVNGGSHIYKGALVVIDTDGYARPAADTADFKFRGVAMEEFDNTDGADGAEHTDGRSGVLVACISTGRYAKQGTIVQADCGKRVCCYDDNTIALPADTSNEVDCGYIESLDGSYVWVRHDRASV